MPQIPRYSEQVQTQGMANARFNTRLPDNPIPGAIAGMSNALGNAANVIGEIGIREADKRSTIEANEFKREVMDTYANIYAWSNTIKGRAVLPGFGEDGSEDKEAMSLTDQGMGEFSEKTAAVMGKLSPAAREKAGKFVDEYSFSLQKHLLTRQASESESHYRNESLATASKLQKELVQSLDTESFNAGSARLKQTLSEIYQGEVLDQKYAEVISATRNTQVLNAIKTGNTATARKIFLESNFDKNSAEYADMKHRLDDAEATTIGTEYIDKAWIPPKNNGPVLNLNDLYAGIDKDLKEGRITPQAANVAETELNQRLSRYEHQRNINIHAMKSDLWQGIDDNKYNLKSAMNAIDTMALPGDDRVTLKRQVEHYFKPPADPMATMVKRLEQDSRLADLQDKIANGDVRIKSRNDALLYAGDIGLVNVGKLLNFAQGYEKVLANPKVTKEQFRMVIEELRASGVKGLPPEKQGGKANPAYAAMQATMMNDLVESQVKTGKMLTDADVKKKFREMAVKEIPVNTVTMLGSVRLWTGTDKKKAWEVQNPSAIDVPALLEAAYKRKPTPQEVQNATAELNKPTTSRREYSQSVKFGGTE